MPHLEWFKK